MATAADMIRRALVLSTVLADDETPTAEQQADALADMNDMLAAWRMSGIECGGPYLATDDLAVPDAFMRALRFNLAVEIAPSYGVSAANVMIGASSLADIAMRAWKAVQNASMDVPDAEFDPAVSGMGALAGRGWWRGRYWW